MSIRAPRSAVRTRIANARVHRFRCRFVSRHPALFTISGSRRWSLSLRALCVAAKNVRVISQSTAYNAHGRIHQRMSAKRGCCDSISDAPRASARATRKIEYADANAIAHQTSAKGLLCACMCVSLVLCNALDMCWNICRLYAVAFADGRG